MLLRYLTILLFLVVITESDVSASENTDSLNGDNFELFSIDGYRLYRYRSPTPRTHEDGITITTDQLLELLTRQPQTVLLDVQPLRWNRVFLQTGPRHNLPGSVWLPNVGEGELAPEWESWFMHHLRRLTNGDKQFPVVIYCRADCWMSWNALKRAARAGYQTLYWYRNGVDGWAEKDLKTQIAQPQPFPE